MKIRSAVVSIIFIVMNPLPSFGQGYTFADVGQVVLPASAAVVTIIKSDGDGAKDLAIVVGTTIGIVSALKYTIETTRPNGEPHSFPSGHTAMAFSGSFFLWKRYGLKYGIPATAVATLVGVSRIRTNKHYPRDVIAGAAIAGGLNLIITERLNTKKFKVSPLLSDKVQGISISLGF